MNNTKRFINQMKLHKCYALLLFVLLLREAQSYPTLKTCATDDRNRGWQNADWSSPRYTSTESVLETSIDTVCPEIDPIRVPAQPIENYLSISGPLGYLGPLGPSGPLGVLGPIGDSGIHPSDWISGIINWHPWAQLYSDLGGPLCAEGPLGHRGPTSPNQYYGRYDPGRLLFSTNDFAVQMRAFGIFSVLGPIGPLGDMGPLGPLGPIGAHGFLTDEDGNYTNNVTIERTLTVPFNASLNRTYELYEFYTTHGAHCADPPDTSFMARGSSDGVDDVRYFPLRSRTDQFVSVVLTPVYTLDEFDLALYNESGGLVAASETLGFVDALQVQMHAGETLYAAVKLRSSGHLAASRFRVSVTGGGDWLTSINAAGDHIRCEYLF